VQLVALIAVLLLPRPAAAYIGPGAGISVIGTAVAFVGALVFAIIGFVWYPLKRLAAALRSSRSSGDEDPKASVS
jgi:uncharacterized membrane protein